jgi:putative ABC transport system permease protein
MAFLEATRLQVTRLYDKFDFDLVLIPLEYQFLAESGTFDRARLVQAGAFDGVAETFSLNIGNGNWVEGTSERASSLLLIGLDPNGDFLRDPELRAGLALLRNDRSVLIDAFSSPGYGLLDTGTQASIADEPVDIAGHFQLGLFFYAEGSAIVRNVDFARHMPRGAREISLGFIRLAEGADATEMKESLVRALPDDVRVLKHNELIEREQAFFLATKPVGIALEISMWIAFLAGAVILFQVLSTEINNRTKEFAVLKAMGFNAGFVYGVGMLEAGLMAVAAFVPALIAGWLILVSVERATHLPTALTLDLALRVLAIAFAMTLVSAGLALRRLDRADPANLY